MAYFDYPLPVRDSIIAMFAGERIGSGASRDVYAVKHDASLVMKVEYAGMSFNNQTEWLVWKDMKDWPIADWFAPCVDIDAYGNVLFQRRTQPFKDKAEFHAAITRTRGGVLPKYLDDVHYANFGLLNDQVVCHDYGYHHFFEIAARSMSVAAGYIKYDDDAMDTPRPYDVTEGGQFALDL